MITLTEYTRRFDMILQAFESGLLTRAEASDAIRELTSLQIIHTTHGTVH